MVRLKIRPADGLKVRDPETFKLIPDDGKEVLISTYWRKRLADKDVVVCEPEKKIEPVEGAIVPPVTRKKGATK